MLALAACLGSPVAGLKMQVILDKLGEAGSLALDAAAASKDVLNFTPSAQEMLADATRDDVSLIGPEDGDAGRQDGAPATTQPVMLGSTGNERVVSKDSSTEDQEKSKKSSGHKLTLGLLGALIVCAAVPVLFSQGWLPFAAVLAYIFSLVAVKLCVKEIFKSGYPYPYATTAFHMLVTAILASCIERPDKAGARDTFLISAVKSASLALNNMALVFGTAAFVSILGAVTPATTYAVEIFRYGKTTTSKSLSILAVVVGAMLCVKGELSFSLLATFLTLGACLCRSLKNVWSHDLMQIDMSPYRLTAWTAVWSLALMAPATMIKEGLAPFRAFPDTSLHTKVVFFAGALLAAALNVLMCFVLKYLGPLQQNIFGQLELVAVLTLAMAWLHETVTTMQWMGVVLIGAGCMLSKLDGVSAIQKLLVGRTPPQQQLPPKVA
jgi:drug/metabolite transporter (DMT)-like permease